LPTFYLPKLIAIPKHPVYGFDRRMQLTPRQVK
jgi:hypothetical protein